MPNDKRVIIEHADGRRYSVTPAAHKKLYPDFTVVGGETGADFVADVPRPAKRAGARRKTTKVASPARIAKPAAKAAVAPPAFDGTAGA